MKPQIQTGISVLMTAYNPGCYLAPAVESILNQTFEDFEFIIVNDGSTDETAEYLDSISDPRVKVFHEVNRGTAGATNFGLQHCNRKYVSRMDADDISLPTRLQQQYSFLEQHDDVALVGTQAQVIGESKAGMSIPLPTEHAEIYRALMNLNHGICHGSCMFRNEYIKRLDGYWKTHHTYDDWDMFLRITEHGKLANLPVVLYQYRFLATSLVGSRLREMRNYYHYAVDCESRRTAGQETQSFEDFQCAFERRPWISRFSTDVGLYALDQYRVATSEICRGNKISGYLRLGLAAACSPKRTLNRLSRLMRVS